MNRIDIHDLPSHVGQELGVSEWFKVDQAMVNAFADLTHDHEWIHVDVERAEREFGGPIAHGYLTLSLVPMFLSQTAELTGVRNGLNYGLNKLRFIEQVRVGKRLRMRQKLSGLEEKAGGVLMINELTIEIEDESRPAMVAEALFIMYPETEPHADVGGPV